MARSLTEIEEELMALPREDRARLAKDLIVSLDEDAEHSQEEIDLAWKEELARRIANLDSGKSILYTHEEVMKELSSRLKK